MFPSDPALMMTMSSINMNLMRIIALLEEIKKDGLNVRTQQTQVTS
jgi:hypothetical protein